VGKKSVGVRKKDAAKKKGGKEGYLKKNKKARITLYKPGENRNQRAQTKIRASDGRGKKLTRRGKKLGRCAGSRKKST